jgi:tetratricopeptide (TPR) repeat protein
MNRIIIVGLLGLFLGSCGNNEEQKIVQETVKSNIEKHRMLTAEIDSLENIFYNDSLQITETTSSALMQAYIEFSSQFIADQENTPVYLYKAAALARANNLPVKAIKYYSQIQNDFPGYIRNSEVAFLLAFTYDEDLNQKELAKEAYQEVVDKYPGDIWAIQSAERLKTIDMTDEELIQFFKEKNNIE